MRRFIHIYHNLSIYYKILLWMLIVSIVPLSLMAFLNISRVRGMEMRRYKAEVNSSLQWIDSMVSTDISDLRQKSINASMEDLLIDLLANNSSITAQDNYELYKILYNLKLSTHCDSAVIIGRNGIFSSTSSSTELSRLMFSQYNQYRDTLKHTKQPYTWGEPLSCGSIWLLPYIRFIRDPEDLRAVGMMSVNYDTSRLSEITRKQIRSKQIPASDVLIVNSGTIISSWNKSLIGTSMSDFVSGYTGQDSFDGNYQNEQCLYLSYRNPSSSDWDYIAVIPYDDIYSSTRNAVSSFIILLLLCIVIIILLSSQVSSIISKPLKYLSDTMAEIGNNNLNIPLKYPKFQDEISQMWNQFITMTERLKESREASEKALIQNQQLHLEALRAQINPHFLYNTFSSVIYLIEEGKQKEATAMLAALSQLLHTSINRTREFIPVEQELGLVRSYMDIQKIRFHNSFRYMIDVDMDVMKLLTVKIILQPVIENVLEHGLKDPADGQTLVIIRGWKEEDLLIFEVLDDGNRLTEQRMLEINQRLESPVPPQRGRHGIGLKNVNDRIRYEFPGDKRLGLRLMIRGRRTVTRIVTKARQDSPQDN